MSLIQKLLLLDVQLQIEPETFVDMKEVDKVIGNSEKKRYGLSSFKK